MLIFGVVLGAGLAAGPLFVLYREEKEDARARINELLTLLELRSAPAETTAFLHPLPAPPKQDYLHSEDGLVSVEVDDGP